MRTMLRGKFTLLFMMLGLLLAVPTVALAADLLTEAELSSQVIAPTAVAPSDTTDFNIRVWARGNINNPNATGDAVITKAYTMGPGGAITANTVSGSTTTVKFQTNHNYGTDGQTCPASVPAQPAGVTGKGCATDPFIVPATLAVGNLAAGTNGTLTVEAVGTQALNNTNPITCTTSDDAIILPNNVADTTDCTKDQGFVRVTVTNNDPTVGTAADDASGNEGDTLTTNNGVFSDADGDTLTIAKQSGAGTVTAGTDGAWSWSLATTDQTSGTVVVRATDPDGAFVEDTFTYSALNVAPTATFNSPDVNEGSNISLSLTDKFDPAGANDTLSYAFDCGSGYGAFGSSDTASCPTTDNGTRTVGAKIKDEDGGVSTYTDSVTITNVAPTATFNYPSAAVNEGDSFNLSLTDPSDPSSADTTAGFTYAFDCGSGYGAFGSSDTASCPTTDNGTRTVGAKIKDKNDGVSTYTGSVTIDNVAPVVDAAGDQNGASEGSSFNFNLGSFTDPGDDSPWAVTVDWGDNSTDTTFTAATAGSLPQKSHTYADNGTYPVTVTVAEAGGSPSHSDTFQAGVANANPVVGALSVTSPTNGVACLTGGNEVKLGFSFTDAGSADTHGYSIAWGDNSPNTVVNSATSPVANVGHTYNSGLGPYTITVTVTDDDGGSGSANNSANPVSFHYNIGTTLLSPVNADNSSIFKLGSTIPLKVNITDCSGAGVSGLSPDIRMIKTSSSAPLTGVDEGISTQPNDTNWVMRGDGNGQYIYNLASKSLPDSTATYKAVITHNGYSVTSTNYFGLKTK
jgi:PKD domain